MKTKCAECGKWFENDHASRKFCTPRMPRNIGQRRPALRSTAAPRVNAMFDQAQSKKRMDDTAGRAAEEADREKRRQARREREARWDRLIG